MAIRFDNGYKEFYMPDGESVLKDYKKGEKVTIPAVPIKQIIYKNDTGYGVYNCEEVLSEGDTRVPGTFLISGTFVEPIDIGQTYEVNGDIREYKGQNQLYVKEIRKILPTNKRGIINFIKSLDGVGIYPELIYDVFGDDSLSVLRDDPQKIVDAFPALWLEKVQDWQKQLAEIKDDHYIMTRLLSYGLKPSQIKGLFDKFGGAILKKIEDNPYFLASEVRNYSFNKCDDIAQAMGMSPSDPMRICEGLYSCINAAQWDGHTYLPFDIAMKSAKDTLSLKIGIQEARRLKKSMGTADKAIYKYGNMSFVVSEKELDASIEQYKQARTKEEKEKMKICVFSPTDDQLKEALETLKLSNRVHIEDDKIFDYFMYEKETHIAWNIKRLKKGFKKINSNIEKYLDNYCLSNGITLEKKQREAILKICEGKGGIFILNGSAGCGKTFCLGIAIEMLKKIYESGGGYFSSFTVAPTGKAAQVAAQATGQETSTVHKLLKYSPSSGYLHNAGNPLYYDLMIVDESSMLDIELADALLDAMDIETKVVFVGDTKQLPSVGAGNVLKDMIASGFIDVTTLDVVKRQGKDSGIIKNANRIISGEIPVSEKETHDAYVFSTVSGEDCNKKILEIIRRRIKQGASIDDIQVLCPQKRGITGTNYLNYILQQEFNLRSDDELEFFDRSFSTPETGSIDLMFKKGDKVIHTKNNYNAQWYGIVNKKLVKLNDVGVANGECGRIIKLSVQKDEYGNDIQSIFVKYDNKIIRYDDDFSELDLAYALTIHKSQGSQWNTVIVPILNSNYMMLDREILYTGYTRAQKMSFLISEKYALQQAVSRVKSEERYTGLKDLLSLE